jgi:hypothetical protein
VRSDTIILGILAHFKHFSGLSGFGCSKVITEFPHGEKGQYESNNREIDMVSDFNPTIIA